MQITITTIAGTFIVPSEKEAQLIAWLQANAVRAGQQQISEVRDAQYPGVQLIND